MKKMLKNSSLKWLRKNNILMLKINENNPITVNAKSIYLSYFSNKPLLINGKEVETHSILKDIPELNFSRYPALPSIYLYEKNNEINLSICIDIENIQIIISENQDQIIVNNKWYPINLDSIVSLKNFLKENSINLYKPINLGQLVFLKSVSSEIPIVESQNINFDHPIYKPLKNLDQVPGLNANLYQYQKEGISFLKLISEQSIGCILADEMGLGKTLQIIALLQLEKLAFRDQSLVVAPATLLENWRREILQFAPNLKVQIHAGINRVGIIERLLGYDVILVSYETLIRDEPLLSSIKWNILILDEAQNIKNPIAQRTLIVKNLIRRVSVAVSGTPVENKLEDLWSIADFVLPRLLGNLNEFQSQFANNDDDAYHLASIVSPIILKRKITDVAKDLPQKIEIFQPIVMSHSLAKKYEALRIDTLKEYGKAANIVATTKLRIFCTHPTLVGTYTNYPASEIPKYQRTMEIVEEIFASGEKVLLFTTYQGMVNIFIRDMTNKWPDAYFNYIDGRIPVNKRQSIIDDFFNYKGFGALFLNPKAAGTGLNITAANHVIHYNPEWNPALTEQASRRAYRRKQEKPVTIHHLYFINTVEEIIIERAEFKKNLAEIAVTGHQGEMDATFITKALEISPLLCSYME